MGKVDIELSERILVLGSPRGLQILRRVSWGVAVLAGLLQTWAVRFWPSSDGNNYLDVAAAYLRGDWKNAVNGYWSPLFSWLLALCLGIFRPHPYWESTVLHLLNFAGFLVGLRCFEFLFETFLRIQEQLGSEVKGDLVVPEFGWWVLGYGLFLSSSLLVLSISAATPDMWLAAFTFVVGGLILRIWATAGGWSLFAALGFVLGLAYLTKAFYFPMTFVFLLAAWQAAGNLRKTVRQAAFALFVFFLVAGPWIFILSRAKGRVTFGDVGKVNLAMMIDQIPQPFFWQGENNTGTPKHPVRLLLSEPRIYEYAAPVGGTYPPAFDLSYWMEGVRPHFSLRGELGVLRQSARVFFQIWEIQIEYGIGVLVLLFLSPGIRWWGAQLRRQPYLWLPGLAACCSYSIVHVEPRHVAPFVFLLWISAFSTLLLSPRRISLGFILALFLAMLGVTGVKIAKSAVSDLSAILSSQEHLDWEVARGLRNLGVQPGDTVSGLSITPEVHWARLAGVRVVSEIPIGDGNIFWVADAEKKRKALQVLASTGSKMLVTREPPLCALKEGWIRLGNTPFYAHPLEVARP